MLVSFELGQMVCLGNLGPAENKNTEYTFMFYLVFDLGLLEATYFQLLGKVLLITKTRRFLQEMRPELYGNLPLARDKIQRKSHGNDLLP